MRVTQTIQSPGNDPVTFPLYTGDDPLGAISAITSAFAMKEDWANENKGAPIQVNTLALHIEF